VKVGEVIGAMVEDEEDVAKLAGLTVEEASAAAGGDAPAPAPSTPPAPAPAPAASPSPAPAPAAASTGTGTGNSQHATPKGGPLRATPLARTLAREAGFDLGILAGTGSGPDGRVVADDVRSAIQSGVTSAAVESTSDGSEGT